jgi:non-heme Fe2+,alpha-ketoglutarate-dependent halogenase
MGKLLSDAQLASFGANGFVSSVPILTAEECGELARRIAKFERDYPNEVPWAFDIKCNLLHDWVVAAGTHPKILDGVEDLIGPDIFLTDAVFRIKEPGSSTDYGWHQDSARIQVDPGFVIVYLTITAATRANGCLEAIPGSHTEVAPFAVVETPGQPMRRVARVENPDVARAMPMALAPGEVLSAVRRASAWAGRGGSRARASSSFPTRPTSSRMPSSRARS